MRNRKTVLFPRDEMIDLLYGDHDQLELVSDRIMDTGRWTVHHELVFRDGNVFYMTGYSEGATEYQEIAPFEEDADLNGNIECVVVEPIEKTVVVYRPVDEENAK